MATILIHYYYIIDIIVNNVAHVVKAGLEAIGNTIIVIMFML